MRAAMMAGSSRDLVRSSPTTSLRPSLIFKRKPTEPALNGLLFFRYCIRADADCSADDFEESRCLVMNRGIRLRHSGARASG